MGRQSIAGDTALVSQVSRGPQHFGHLVIVTHLFQRTPVCSLEHALALIKMSFLRIVADGDVWPRFRRICIDAGHKKHVFRALWPLASPSIRTTRVRSPVSSNISRTAASSGVSPYSIPPPGSVQYTRSASRCRTIKM